MIISRHSGNVVGYLDYYAEASYRVKAITGICRMQNVKLRECFSENLEGNPYFISRQVQPPVTYKYNGEYCTVGNLIDLTV